MPHLSHSADSPDHGPSHFLKAFLLKKKGDVAGAIANYEKACAELPESFQARQSLGNLYLDNKRYTDALRCFEQAYAIAEKAESQNPEAQNALSTLRALLDQVREKAAGG